MENIKIASPCVSVCKSDPISGYCYGCGRTNDEIEMWGNKETGIDWKKENISQIKKRLSGLVLSTFENNYKIKSKRLNKVK